MGGAERIVVHGGAPDVAAGLAGKGVIDGAGQDGIAEGQEQVKDTAAQIVKVPAGLTKEAVKGTKVFELGEVAGLNDAGERAAAGTEDPSTGQGPERAEAGLSETGLEGEQERGKGMDQEIGHGGASSFS